MKPKFELSEYKNTIRVMPQNYCIMTRRSARWMLDPDGALDTELCCSVVRCITGDYRMNKFISGVKLVEFLNEAISIEV